MGGTVGAGKDDFLRRRSYSMLDSNGKVLKDQKEKRGEV